MSMLLPAGPRTDVEILRLGGSKIVDRGDHLVVRTPAQPTYHWGNYLQLLPGADQSDVDRWVSAFHHEFPTAEWLAIGLPSVPDQAVAEAYEDLFLEVTSDDVLVADHLPRATANPPGYVVRPFDSDDDWQQQRRAYAAENAADGRFEKETHDAFVTGQIASRRRRQAAGSLQWFGAFVDDSGLAPGRPGELAADLGIVVLGDDARYQSVGTQPDHRRRGLAGHLLGVAARWAAERGATRWVIVTESTNDAGRVYRSVGFEDDAKVVTVYRRPSL